MLELRAPASPRPSAVWLFTLAMGSNLLGLLLPLALLQVYDRILPSAEYGTAVSLFALVALSIVMDGVLRVTAHRSIMRWGALREHGHSVGLAARLLAAPAGELRLLPSGMRRGLFSALAQARSLDGAGTRMPLLTAPFAAMFLGLVWYIVGTLVLVPLAVLAVTSAVAVVVMTRQRDAAIAAAAARQEADTAMGEAMARLVEVKALGYAGPLGGRIDAAMRAQAVATERAERLDSLLADILQAGSLAATVGLTIAGAQWVLAGNMTTGALAASSLLAGRGVGAGLGVFSALARRSAAQAALAQLRPLAAVPSRPHASDEGLDVPDGITRIDGPDARARLRAMARLEAGEEMATSRRPVLVPERPVLFIGTLLDNLTGWDASRAEAARAMAGALGLTALTDRLPEGLHTRIAGTVGDEVSEGIAKRVALGRALLSGKALLLEFPETGLDADGRHRLAEVLRNRSRVVLATHDPALAALATAPSAPAAATPEKVP